MFFIVSKLLSFLIHPLSWVFALLLWALFTKNLHKRKVLLIIAVCTLYFFSNAFILAEFMRAWETPAIEDYDLPGKYDAGIVLGGMIAYDHSYKRPQFNRSGDRIFQAISLYRSGKIRKIFLSGGSGSMVEKDVCEATMLRDYIIKLGVPDSSIIVETHSKNTRENALFAKPVLDSLKKNGKYLLITSAFHLPRAMKAFRKAGIDVTAYSVDRFSGPRKFIFDHLFIPDTDTLSGWDTLLHEWVGYITYKIAGYI